MSIALSIAWKACSKAGSFRFSPSHCNSIPQDRIIETGLALSWFWISGAEPCCAWAQQWVSLAIIEPARPRLPDNSLARSEMMSP